MVRSFVATLAAVGLSLGTPAPVQAAEAEDGSHSFAACVRGEREARLVLLMDESGSLQESDPDGTRVDAAQHLIGSWARQVDGSDIDLQIQVMSFFDTGRSTADWSPVTDTEALSEHLESYRTRQEGNQTDYLMGLNAARSALTSSSDGASPCSAIVWFSDGELEAGPEYAVDGEDVLKPYIEGEMDSAAVTQVATEELCRDGGAADQLRAAGINLMAIGLASGTAEASDFDLMRSIAAENSCGALTPKGSFLLAEDLEQLLFAFANVARPEAPITQETAVCQGGHEDECLHRFVLDDSISGVDLMVTSDVTGLDIVIVPPEGEPVTAASSDSGAQVDVGNATVQIEPLSARTTNIVMEGTGGWSGQWGVGLVDPASNSGTSTSRSSLHLTADVQPVWLQSDESLRSGDSTEQSFGLQRQDGTSIDPAGLLGTMALDISFETPDGESIPVAERLDAEAMIEPQALDLTDTEPGQGVMRYVLNLTTADFETSGEETIPGTQLAPLQVSQQVLVQPPLGLPEVGPSIAFAPVLDGAQTSGELAVTGPGCIWIDPSTAQVLAGPEAASPVSLGSDATSADTCLRVEEGQTTALPLTLDTAAPALGGLSGELSVHLAPLEDPSRDVVVAHPFSADLDKSPHAGAWWTTVILLVTLAVGIPLALLYFTKWRASRIRGQSLFAETFPLDLEEGRLAPAGFPHEPGPDVFRNPRSVPAKGTKGLDVGEVTLRVVHGWSPLGTGEVRASVPGMVGVSKAVSQPSRQGAARLPLAVQNQWALFRAQDGESALLLYLPTLDRGRDELVAELSSLEAEVDSALQAISESGVAATPGSGAHRARREKVGATSAATAGGSGSAIIGADEDFDGSSDASDWGWDEPSDVATMKDEADLHAPLAAASSLDRSAAGSAPVDRAGRSEASTGATPDEPTQDPATADDAWPSSGGDDWDDWGLEDESGADHPTP